LIAIVLAGGYGTRLRELTWQLPKPLLKVAGRPIIDYVFDKLLEIDDVYRVIVGTNLKFQPHFEQWLASNPRRRADIIPDRSYSEEQKPGAIASLTQTVSDINDDCLIIGGDNLFTSSLKPMNHMFKERARVTVALHNIMDQELAKQYSIANLDRTGRVTSFVEKPSRPDTTLIGTCIYMIPRKSLSRMAEYLSETSDRDSPGRFIAWLCAREPVYGHVLDGYWWDIGTIDQYREADMVLIGLKGSRG